MENEEKEGLSVLQGTWRLPNHSGLWSLSWKASGRHFLGVGVSGWLADQFHLPSLAPGWASGPGTPRDPKTSRTAPGHPGLWVRS